jgi:hypothetical protein
MMDYLDEDHILDVAMRNSYDIIVNKLDAGEILMTDFGFLVHNPAKPLKKEEVTNMIYYFQSIEEYEKCIELKKIMESK